MSYKGYRNYSKCLNMIESLRRFDKSEDAHQRLKIINFYKEYGEKATKETFEANRKVISRWCQRLKRSSGKIQALVPISTRPNRLRESKIDEIIIENIRGIRQERYRISKYKLKSIYRQILWIIRAKKDKYKQYMVDNKEEKYILSVEI